MIDVALDETPRIIQRQWRSGPNALSFERFMPTFDFAVRLGIVRRGSDVCHARDPNEFFEVLGMNCGPLSEMIRGRASGCSSLPRCRMISMSASVMSSTPADPS